MDGMNSMEVAVNAMNSIKTPDNKHFAWCGKRATVYRQVATAPADVTKRHPAVIPCSKEQFKGN
jgi:hypothetical protein